MPIEQHGSERPYLGRHARFAASIAARREVDHIKTPRLAALFRRHPGDVRWAAAGAIVGGLALFVVASVAMAGADPARPKVAAGQTTTVVAAAPLDLYPTGVPTAAAAEALTAKPRHIAKPAPADASVISGLADNGIPTVALNAYRVAAARMANVDPGCGIDWALLAGIGREESDHGRFAGAVLHADGTSTPRIIGPALDGTTSEYIPAPPNGQALDGDTKYAHALGPMQFIPSTWAQYGTDANGDGRADVFNINDAALTAARYLCAAGGDLHTHAGQVAAVLAYNHSDQYLAQVLALADAYRRGIPISGIPTGNVTGGLPPLNASGAVPPANPGNPTANSPAAPKTKPTTAPKPGTSTTPATGTGGTPSTGTSGTPTAGSATTAGGTSPTPGAGTTPAPGTTATKKCLLPDLLNPGKCAIWG